jgi:putative ABC transport system substrate-binding protein
MNTELAAKRLELLREVAPRISRIAVLSNSDNVPDRQQVNALRDADAKVGVAIIPIDVRMANDYSLAFERAEAKAPTRS